MTRTTTARKSDKATPRAAVGVSDMVPMPPKTFRHKTGGGTLDCARSDDLCETTLAFIRTLRIPEGPLHGQNFNLAPFQEKFVRGVMDPAVRTAMLSVGRGQGKSMLAAALGLAHVMGVSDPQPRRQGIIAARVKEQARISWEYMQAIVHLLPEEEQALFTFRQAPRLEISYEGNGGGMIRAVAADAKNLLGLSPTLIVEDEFGHWHPDKGAQLHAALETSAGKRQAKIIIISTSASDDTHPFSAMLDTPPPHSFIIECRAPLGMPADDLDGLKLANPGSEFGIGPSLKWLQEQAEVAIQRGGQALQGFRLYSLNQRVSDVGKAQLITVDEWQACEVNTGYTGLIMAARESYISGASGIGELTATVQGCISLWEGAMALADVQGTRLLTRHVMALAARSVAIRGESVFLIRGDRLLSCADWDLSTRGGVPRAYRVSVAEAGGNLAETVLAQEVLHFKAASDPVAPWTGSAPLRRAAISASLLHEVETALRDVFRDAPLGSQIVPLPDSSAQDMEAMRGAFRGKRGATLVIEGVAQSTAAGMNPQLGQRAEQLSPDLSKAMATQTLEAARDAVCMAFGVLPGLHDRAAQGNAIREGQRHLATWTLQPLAALWAEEATAKLGTEVFIDCLRPVQAFDVSGRARALSTIIGAMAEAKAAGLAPGDVNAALTLVNWGANDGAA